MKKALVMTFVLVLGLGFAAFADGTLSGVWDTDVSLYPAASVFGDFIKSFTSGIDIEYTIGGFTFGMDSTFKVAGLTGVEFDVDGTLGAFTLSAEIDFAPRILATTKTEYTVLQTKSVTCGGFTGSSVSWDTKTVTTTYTAGFDDLKLEVSVSIAGVSLDALFFLEGEDNVGSYKVYGNYGTVVAAATGQTLTVAPVQTTSYATVASSTNQGSGWKLTASGSFGGATLTGRAYFNLKDDWGSYAEYLAAYGWEYAFSDYFTESGSWAIVCDDCIARFTSFDLIVEDVTFSCLSFAGLLTFDCCGFDKVRFVVEDIGLGCCWDLGFDLMITFSDTAKTVSIDPQITLANACFTLDADLVYDYSETDGERAFELEGIDIRGLGLEYSWNGITFSAETTWDYTNNPILGTYGYISGPTKIYALQPDTDFTSLDTTYDDEVADKCTVDATTKPAIDMSTGIGYWEVTSFACERAYVWEKFGIDVDGDSCCGGAFDISAVFYFGDIKELTDLDGTYYFDADFLGTYTDYDGTTTYTFDADDAKEYYVFYGTHDKTDIPGVTSWTAGCNCCPCDDCTMEVDEVEWDDNYTAVTNTSRLFDWIEADVDVELGIGSGFTLTFGLDVTCWGWEDFTFGFEFTF